jgi:hypothetical protein
MISNGQLGTRVHMKLVMINGDRIVKLAISKNSLIVNSTEFTHRSIHKLT